ncbi:MAG: hypothetical protein LBU21_10115 [Treponema sp.]|jgi:hypothetical protein|nr:hypothetical protein [Treponema sp.]
MIQKYSKRFEDLETELLIVENSKHTSEHSIIRDAKYIDQQLFDEWAENRLIKKGDVVYSYDKDGNLVSEQGVRREAAYEEAGERYRGISVTLYGKGEAVSLSTTRGTVYLGKDVLVDFAPLGRHH